jgi:hypothetical protein
MARPFSGNVICARDAAIIDSGQLQNGRDRKKRKQRKEQLFDELGCRGSPRDLNPSNRPVRTRMPSGVAL